MRDLYNRKEKLASWILKVKTELEEPDRIHVFQFVELSLFYLKKASTSNIGIILTYFRLYCNNLLFSMKN